MRRLVLAAIRVFMKTIANGGRNDELELLGYAHESWNHSKGRFAGTNQGENIWSVTKRHARKLFGGRILTRQLDSLCREWMES